jgi:hypothetical protein
VAFLLRVLSPKHFTILCSLPYMPPLRQSPWFYLRNDIWGWVQIMKLLIVRLPPFSCYSMLNNIRKVFVKSPSRSSCDTDIFLSIAKMKFLFLSSDTQSPSVNSSVLFRTFLFPNGLHASVRDVVLVTVLTAHSIIQITRTGSHPWTVSCITCIWSVLGLEMGTGWSG